MKLIWFDFHNECKKMKYENLSKLLAEIQNDLDDNKLFEASFKKTNPKDSIDNQNHQPSYSILVSSQQKGVCRTNCMDCLDRTNVVQCCIARRLLHEILVQADIEKKNPTYSVTS